MSLISLGTRQTQILCDAGDLAPVQLEIDDLPGLGFFFRQPPLDLAPELLSWQQASIVQPGCTIKLRRSLSRLMLVAAGCHHNGGSAGIDGDDARIAISSEVDRSIVGKRLPLDPV
jgi:hypothetical protein